MGSPRATQNYVVFSIKEIGCSKSVTEHAKPQRIHTSISWVQWHRFESFVSFQCSASPFPYSTHLCLPPKIVAIGSNGNWMPILEAYVGSAKVGEKLLGVFTLVFCSWWRALLDSIIDKVAKESVVEHSHEEIITYPLTAGTVLLSCRSACFLFRPST